MPRQEKAEKQKTLHQEANGWGSLGQDSINNVTCQEEEGTNRVPAEIKETRVVRDACGRDAPLRRPTCGARLTYVTGQEEARGRYEEPARRPEA